MPKCNINGKEIEVKEGTRLIDAFKEAGEDIAHYCYHPGLSVAGCCRLCMVEIEGNPRLQIACNTTVQDGMSVSNQSPAVKDAVKWGLDFHLINHPLDCPICDQAGECELQIQYMKFGKYDSEMAEPKVKKHKVVDLGPKIVLDTERCILCSRCVRFTDEVSKTHELGIFNRGDRSEIGTHENKPLDNNYAVNTVDICPVGALTSKDFRFRQRVWYLKNSETVCNGCSTGCSVKTYYNEEGLFRVKPVYNEEVNGYWMCDFGRDIYKYANKEVRIQNPELNSEMITIDQAITEFESRLKTNDKSKTAVVVTGQQTVEEYESILGYLKENSIDQVYHWINNPDSFEDFDGLLIRGDKNPNTKGLLEVMDKNGFNKPWSELVSKLEANEIDHIVVVAPENVEMYPDMEEKVQMFSKAKQLTWLGTVKNDSINDLKIPMKSFVEKAGTFVNFEGRRQNFKKVTVIVKNAICLTDMVSYLKNKTLEIDNSPEHYRRKMNYFTQVRGGL